jgi:hypothetical protein
MWFNSIMILNKHGRLLALLLYVQKATSSDVSLEAYCDWGFSWFCCVPPFLICCSVIHTTPLHKLRKKLLVLGRNRLYIWELVGYYYTHGQKKKVATIGDWRTLSDDLFPAQCIGICFGAYIVSYSQRKWWAACKEIKVNS